MQRESSFVASAGTAGKLAVNAGTDAEAWAVALAVAPAAALPVYYSTLVLSWRLTPPFRIRTHCGLAVVSDYELVHRIRSPQSPQSPTKAPTPWSRVGYTNRIVGSVELSPWTIWASHRAQSPAWGSSPSKRLRETCGGPK